MIDEEGRHIHTLVTESFPVLDARERDAERVTSTKTVFPVRVRRNYIFIRNMK